MIIVKSLTQQQAKLVSGGSITVHLNPDDFVIIPTTDIPEQCAHAFEYGFNGLLNNELTTADVISVSLTYGKCTVEDYQFLIKNVESMLVNYQS